jgi:hypothetical protein
VFVADGIEASCGPQLASQKVFKLFRLLLDEHFESLDNGK